MESQFLQLYVFFFLTLLTAAFVGGTTHLMSDNPTMHMLALSGRMVLLLGNSLLLYMLTGSNKHIKSNHFGAYLQQFSWFYGSVLVAIALDFLFGLTVIISVSRTGSHSELTKYAWYWVVNISMQLSYCFQVLCATRTTAFVFVDSD